MKVPPWILGVVALGTVVGCATVAIETPSPVPFSWRPLAVYRADGTLDAYLAGRLEITDDCVFVHDGSERRLVVWFFDPSQWGWDPNTRELVGSGRFGNGDLIGLGGYDIHGGAERVEGILRAMNWIYPPDLSCITPSVWIASGDMRRPSPDDLPETIEETSGAGV